MPIEEQTGERERAVFVPRSDFQPHQAAGQHSLVRDVTARCIKRLVPVYQDCRMLVCTGDCQDRVLCGVTICY